MQEILNDPLKTTMLIILAALEIPAMVFLTVAWFKAKKEYAMENYLMINGKQIPLTKEQVQQIMGTQDKKEAAVELGTLAPGDTFKIGATEFLVLEQEGETTAAIKKGLLVADMEFGKNNNYAESPIRSTCEEFAEEIAGEIGEENLLEHTVDLTANDGMKDYGEITARASILTADRYRKYVQILDSVKMEDYWWLATPWSTPHHGIEYAALCVSPSGYFSYYFCDDSCGVRPFCILKSTILVSR